MIKRSDNVSASTIVDYITLADCVGNSTAAIWTRHTREDTTMSLAGCCITNISLLVDQTKRAPVKAMLPTYIDADEEYLIHISRADWCYEIET